MKIFRYYPAFIRSNVLLISLLVCNCQFGEFSQPLLNQKDQEREGDGFPFFSHRTWKISKKCLENKWGDPDRRIPRALPAPPLSLAAPLSIHIVEEYGDRSSEIVILKPSFNPYPSWAGKACHNQICNIAGFRSIDYSSLSKCRSVAILRTFRVIN